MSTAVRRQACEREAWCSIGGEDIEKESAPPLPVLPTSMVQPEEQVAVDGLLSLFPPQINRHVTVQKGEPDEGSELAVQAVLLWFDGWKNKIEKNELQIFRTFC